MNYSFVTIFLLFIFCLELNFDNTHALSFPHHNPYSVRSGKKKVLADKSSSEICKKSKLLPTDGKQLESGSCSSTQQGEIPNVNHMVSSLIVCPENGAVIKSNQTFEVVVITENLETGHFSDPEKDYYKFSQQLNNQGQIKGHQHVTIQKIDRKNPPDALNPNFFQGLNDKAKDDKLKVTVDQGLEKGSYRICTMSGSFSHQPLLMPIAKRGSQDDCIRIKIE